MRSNSGGPWRRLHMAKPLIAGVLVMAANAFLPFGHVRLGGLDAGERIEVAYRSQGCFHDVRAKLVFTRQNGQVRYRVNPETWPGLRPHAGVLTPAQAAALDAELRWMRRPRLGGCTTETRIEVDRYVRGVLAGRDRYADTSCSSPAGALSFADLVDPRP